MNLHGFTKSVMTDHEFAAWLRKHNAVDTYEHYLNSARWFDGNRKIIAVALYDNSATKRTIYLGADDA